MKAVSPQAASNRPHVFGFLTPRGGSDPLLEVWNDDDGTVKVFSVLPGGVSVNGTLTGGAHALDSASHPASGLTVGEVLRATAADAFGFGALVDDDIPNLPASKITSEEFHVDRIPTLDAAKIGTGTFAEARIPDLGASKVTSGAFHVDRIPTLDAAKVGSGLLDPARIPVTYQTIDEKTANYVLVLTDAGKCIEMDNASARTITVPPNSSVAFPVGTLIDLARTGAGSVEVVAGSGVTIQASVGRFLRAQHSMATLQKRGTNTWRLIGDLNVS
jgi:hypothetical protein